MKIHWYTRSDSFLRDTAPKITLRHEHIGYNAVFVKEAKLNRYNRVRPGIDYENFRIYFQFSFKDKSAKDTEGKFTDTLALYSSSPNGTTKSTGAQKLYEQHALIRNISEYENSKYRQFEVTQDPDDSTVWFAQLHPTFEHIAKPDTNFNDLRGIYRYKSNNLVVYIGKGDIEARKNAPQRKKWIYDAIEYSVINDPDRQFEWENFWLERYKEENEGKLPLYNYNSGRSH